MSKELKTKEEFEEVLKNRNIQWFPTGPYDGRISGQFEGVFADIDFDMKFEPYLDYVLTATSPGSDNMLAITLQETNDFHNMGFDYLRNRIDCLSKCFKQIAEMVVCDYYFAGLGFTKDGNTHEQDYGDIYWESYFINMQNEELYSKIFKRIQQNYPVPIRGKFWCCEDERGKA